MAATESEMLELGTVAPDFNLPDPDGVMHALGEGKQAYLVMFICNHCPCATNWRASGETIRPRLFPSSRSTATM